MVKMKNKSMQIICSMAMLTFLMHFSCSSPVKKYTGSASDRTSVKKKDIIEFTIPLGFVMSEITAESPLKYCRIIKHCSKKLEIRYLAYTGTSSGDDPNFKEQEFREKTMEIARIISAEGTDRKFSLFRESDANSEFNADMGVTASLKVNRNYSDNYKYIILVGMHRNGTGHAYMIFLLNNLNDTTDEIQSAFHSMKFSR